MFAVVTQRRSRDGTRMTQRFEVLGVTNVLRKAQLRIFKVTTQNVSPALIVTISTISTRFAENAHFPSFG